MTAPWILVIIVVTGGLFSSDAKFHNIPIMNKEACTKVAKDAANRSSKHLGFICINTETGETIEFGMQK